MTNKIMNICFKDSEKYENTKIAFVKSDFHQREVICITNSSNVENGVEYLCDVTPMKEGRLGLIATNVRIEFEVVRTKNKLIVFWNGRKYVWGHDFENYEFDIAYFTGEISKKNMELFTVEFSKFKEESKKQSK